MVIIFTVAPADLYDSRFFEVVQSHIKDSSPEYWDSRVIKVIILFFIVFLVFFFVTSALLLTGQGARFCCTNRLAA